MAEVTLYRIGDFYEAFGEDARVVAEVCCLHVSRVFPSKANRYGRMCGFMCRYLDKYVDWLVAAEVKVVMGGAFRSHSEMVVRLGMGEVVAEREGNL